ncbi:MAG: cation transporter [Planctomycetaceae bacterium]|nr:cation transporter [Planctomycetaceae bacterium]
MVTFSRPVPQKSDEVLRITLFGAIANFFLVILKFFAGFCGNSSVMVADAVHSMSDFVTDLAVIIGARYWEQPADSTHPYGHAKLETIVTLFIGVILALAGLRLMGGAISTLHSLITDDNFHQPIPGKIALIAAGISIIVKEILYQITARTGRKIRSSAVVANAWHHRSDALSSIPAFGAIGFCCLWGERYAFLDPVATILVGGMILYTAWLIIYPTFGTLMDAGASQEIIHKISTVVQSVPGANNPHKIRTRSMGEGYDVDLHVWVDGNTTVFESHCLAHSIEQKLKEVKELQILDVIIHIEPIHDTDCSNDQL